MRNKILVLVLALICLFAVSALAADHQWSELTAAQQKLVGDAVKAHGGWDYIWRTSVAEGDRLVDTDASKDPYKLGGWDLSISCNDAGSVTLYCYNKDCTVKTHGTDTITNGNGTLVGKPFTVALPKYEHTMDEIAASNIISKTSATCAKKGSIVYVCANNVKHTKELPKVENHDMVTTIIAPDCLKNAVAVTKCSFNCGKETAKVEITNGTLAEQYVNLVPGAQSGWWKALGHDYKNSEVEYVVVPTCANGGKAVFVNACSRCGVDNPDTPSYVKDVPAIKHSGVNAADATNLSKIFAGNYKPTTKVNANGLYYVTDVLTAADSKPAVYVNDIDGNTVLSHGKYTYKVVAPACEKEGTVTIACANCGETLKFAIEALKHDWKLKDSSDAASKAEDCTKPVSGIYQCDNCEIERLVNEPGHATHNYVEVFNIASEYCYYVQYKNDGRTKVVAETKAEFDEKIAKCIPYYQVFSCTNNNGLCKVEKIVEIKPAATKKHSVEPLNGVYYTKVDATCASAGSATYACADCGNVITVEYPILTAESAHKVEKWTTTPAKCDEDGSKVGTCKICKKEITKVLPAFDHNYKVDATLSVPVDHCHDGQEVKVCTICGDVETKVLYAQHSDPDAVDCIAYKAPSCTEKGYKTFKCDDCNKEVTVYIAKEKHVMVADATKDVKATCCSPAYTFKTCAKCGAIEPTVVGDALGHDEELSAATLKKILADIKADGVVNVEKNVIVTGAPTCTTGAEGKKLCKELYRVYKQKTDGTWYYEEETCKKEWNFTLPAYGHDWQAATLNAVTGKYEVKCAICKEIKDPSIDKPQYEVILDGTKGKVVLKNNAASPLAQAWVRISYGFELSDGSYLAMTTCMPINFVDDQILGTQVGTFSFFALNTSLESTGVNIMVVDQYDAMYKTIGELVGNNYGLYTA